MTTPLIKLAAIEAYCFRVPVTTPITVSFGTFRDRPFVLVRVVDTDGAVGWGEAWANWPAVGAEHRARLVTDIGERLIGQPFASPPELFRHLSASLEVLVLQTGEVGPMAQAVAGIDIAVWDLVSRKAGQPLYRMLGAGPVSSVPVYATGINPDGPEHFAAARQAEGHRAFKLKTGFGNQRDVNNLRAMRAALGEAALLTCDANQSHTLASALEFCRSIEDLRLSWFEEPLRVDAPDADWRTLAAASTTPLAGGENFHAGQFQRATGSTVLQVIQPDVTKWGGISGNWEVAQAAVAAGKRYCPHYFGGGISLLSSLHLLAAAGGAGLLEFDCHPNVGREAIVGALLPVHEGRVPVPQTPGLGSVPDLAALAPFQTCHVTI